METVTIYLTNVLVSVQSASAGAFDSAAHICKTLIGA